MVSRRDYTIKKAQKKERVRMSIKNNLRWFNEAL